MKQLCSA